jgi:hypothetical protein
MVVERGTAWVVGKREYLTTEFGAMALTVYLCHTQTVSEVHHSNLTTIIMCVSLNLIWNRGA